ncbi:MAG: bifunctional acetate--CoA ligase family protein/GNAT family N-acetyltransferase [Bryobacterales bacterium]|nr:bifunctional acetate--CoA ligase family protein/GNAT family N-acetyltransferase [Bryobacterales bacterium]
MNNKVKKRQTESAHDIWRGRDPLDVFFQPKNVAVIGATEAAGSVGRTTLWNLISSPFGGTVFPVNPKRPSILGIKAYPTVKDVPAEVDLAVIVTAAQTVPTVLQECADAGVEGAIVISAGFQELGEQGEALQRQLKEIALASGMRVIGPNCLGLMSPLSGLNASFAASMARPGSVGFISQSGALCTAVLDWSMEAQIGFSAFISCGAMVDVNWGDLIYYLGQDTRTRSILIYMESVGDARSFLSAAREVALQKPIIVIKAGRTAAGGKAAASHTGAMTGSDDVLDAAFRRCGVLRVGTIAELFYMAEVLAKQPRPQGRRLTIMTNAGGPAVLATDALISAGGELTQLSEKTMADLNAFLPPHWSRNNPVDILGDAGADRYAKALEICTKDPNSDGMLVILTPQAMTDATKTAEMLKPYASIRDKPVLASWMGGPEVEGGIKVLNGANIPVFPYPDTAARMFYYMYRYTYNLQGLYETPALAEEDEAIDRATVGSIIDRARKAGRTLLTEAESKAILRAYGIPAPACEVAHSVDAAIEAAEGIGYPVVVKLHSETLTHKTDVGGVVLNVTSPGEVRRAFESIQLNVEKKAGKGHFLGVTVQPMVRMPDSYELILGSSMDPQFGPVLLFGVGGQLVEVFQDRALALPPLTSTLARRMMEQTRIYTALKGVRGRAPVDLAELEQMMVHFSQLVAEQRLIKEIDINPLLASSDGLVALDARVVLHESTLELKDIPRLAIRPYPRRYESTAQMKNGETVTIRPIRAEDEPLIIKFHETLSERTVYFRYLQMLNLGQRTAHERLIRICFIDYNRELALVVIHNHEIIGVGRLHKLHGTNEAEFAEVISDAYQGQGLGKLMLNRLIDVARAEGITRVVADIHAENVAMQAVCKKLGFRIEREFGDPTVSASLDL